MASGQSDNMLVATYLSAKCPVFFAPAMDLDMWQHPSTKSNVEKLLSYGNHMIPVGHGELASGLVGEGRMAEPGDIVAFLDAHSKKKADLKGTSILITAGPTREPLDPIRFLSNHSTGRMGIALAEECVDRGAKVYLVLGPTSLRPVDERVNVIDVQSAEDMYHACREIFTECSVAIFAAAVADYTPEHTSDKKIKKAEGDMDIAVKRTVDIASTLGKIKRDHQVTCGFALETNNEASNAQRKLDKKNFDLIVLNSLKEKGAGFKYDTNKITIYQHNIEPKSYPLKSKRAVAVDIVDTIIPLLAEKSDL